MKTEGSRRLRILLVIVLSGFLQGAGSAAAAREDDPASDQGKKEANALLDMYIRAFQTRDFSMASEVYAHDSDLVVYGSNPSDRRLGWSQTEDYLQKYFAACDRIEIVLKERNIKIHRSGAVAWFAQVLKWTEAERGKTYTMDGLRITGVLEKRDGGWVIVQLHASGPPPVS